MGEVTIKEEDVRGDMPKGACRPLDVALRECNRQ
jgi:hypothetical protein